MKKEIRLDYGKKGLVINLEDVDIIEPLMQKPLQDPVEILRKKLATPDFGPGLNELAKNKKNVAIAHTDITRATPNRLLIPPIIEELEALGIKRENIVLVNMTGSHRAQTEAELEAMLGPEIVAKYRCVQHNSFDKSTMDLAGHLDGYPLYINKEFLQADLKICTGFIEPHFFAGFSGGPKAVLPGLCDIDSIMRNHNAPKIADENASWGITKGNPVWENIRAGCSLVNPDLLVNVSLNTEEKISGVFVGEWEKTHELGYEFVRASAMRKVSQKYDLVIGTNSGYPLDMNLYQCVKGMSCAAQIVKEGGSIIIAGECSEGIPKASSFEKILRSESSPQKLFKKITESKEVIPEQWQAQIQTRIQLKADIYLYSDFLSDEDIKGALLLPCRDIEALVKKLGGKVAVIPKGPQTIPYC